MAEITYTEALPDPAAYFRLFESTGWNAEYGLAPGELFAALARSWYAVHAYAGGMLAGSGRVISDGVAHALILDVIVLPAYQRCGIGEALMERLLARCGEAEVRDVQLFCATGKAPFYERLGFRARPAAAPGMELRR